MEGLIILMAAFGLAGMGCVAYGGYQLWFTNRLQRKGIALEGTIVHRVTRSAWSGCSISYRYACEGKDYFQDQRISIRHIDDYDPGRTVIVYCFPRHPARARMRDTSWYTSRIGLGIGLVLLILFLLFAVLQNGQIQ